MSENTKTRHEQYPPDLSDRYEDEIDLAELLGVLIRRKKVIFATLGISLATALIVIFFILTPQYEIGALLRPGITGFDDKGQPVSDFKAQDLKAWIQGGAYEQILFKKYGNEIPRIKVSIDRNGSIITLKLYHEDPKTGKAILNDVIAHIGDERAGLKIPHRFIMEQIAINKEINEKRRELKMIDAEKQKINNDISKLKREIDLINMEKGNIEDEIAKLQKDLEMIDVEKSKISRKIEFLNKEIQNILKNIEIIKKDKEALKKAKNTLETKIKEINKNSNELIKARNNLIQSKQQDKMTLLLFSNSIQENLGYISNLEYRILQINKEINEKNDKINQKFLKIEQLKNKIDLFKIKQTDELNKKKFDIEIDIKKLENQKDKTLDKKLKDIAANIEKLKIKRDKELEKKKLDLQDQIKELQAKCESMALVEVIQPPYSSPKPVKPKKALLLALTICCALFMGIFLAFIKEFLENNRAQISK